jgi:hypothetical protein
MIILDDEIDLFDSLFSNRSWGSEDDEDFVPEITKLILLIETLV